jgi:hypothetical protein
MEAARVRATVVRARPRELVRAMQFSSVVKSGAAAAGGM